MAQQQVPVQSSMISTVGYDDDSQTLQVTFNNGRTYSYDAVPADEFASLVNAPSVGQYFLQNIRDAYRTR